MPRGRLITIEGLDGAGKSTQAAALGEALTSRGVAVAVLREPGGVEVSERVRSLVTDPSLEVSPRAETLLYAAARAQLVAERLEPLLAEGTWVVLDRFVDSSLAYQGGGRGLGVDAVRAVNEFATGGLAPDRTVLLAVDRSVGRSRQASRGGAPDRLEREGDDFFSAIEGTYAALAASEPERIRVVEAGAPPEDVARAVLAAVEDLLP